MKRNTSRIPPYLLILLALTALVFVSGCNDESVKVMFDQYEQSGGKIESLKTVAVLDFEGKNSGTGSDIADQLADRFSYQGYFLVMDRSRMKQILRDKGLPVSGIVSPEDARQIAAALGVDALVYGNADTYFNSAIKYREIYLSYGYAYPYYRGRYGRGYYNYRPREYVPYLNRSGYADLDVHFYDARINKEMGVIDLKKNYNKDYDQYYASANGRVYFFDRLQKTEMPSDSDMMVMLADQAVSRLIDNFTPYYVSHVRKLWEGIPGVDLAQQGKWDEAKAVWEKFVQNSPTNIAANINLGIYYERQGNPIRALSYYKTAYNYVSNTEPLRGYIEQVGRAADIRRIYGPVTLDANQTTFKVVEVKNDGRVFLIAGQKEGVMPGQRYVILRPHVAFDTDLVTAKGIEYVPVGNMVIDKTFEGVSWGAGIPIEPGKRPREGDVVVQVESEPPPQPNDQPPTDQPQNTPTPTPPVQPIQ